MLNATFILGIQQIYTYYAHIHIELNKNSVAWGSCTKRKCSALALFSLGLDTSHHSSKDS